MRPWLWNGALCLAMLVHAPSTIAQTTTQSQTATQSPSQTPMPSQTAAATQTGATASKADAAAFELDILAPGELASLLQRHLELQRYRALDDLSDAELDRLLDAAHDDVGKLAATLGYFSPVIAITRVPEAHGAGTRRVQISVAPGEPVRIGGVRIDFAGDITSNPRAAAQRQLITDSWLLPAGQRFTQAQWDAAKQQALRQLTSVRYPLGRISQSLAEVDPPTHSAQLQLKLNSGDAFQTGAMEISGLQRYDADLVQRLARVPTGIDYDLRELVAAQQRLSSSGFFDSAFVRIDTQSPPQAAKVQVTVREAPLKKMTLGVGASTNGGARLSIEHLHHRVPGLGWRALSTLSVDRETQSVGTDLTSPPDADGWRWNAALQLQNQRSGSFEDVGSQRWRVGTSQATQNIDRNYYLQYDRADSATSAASVASVAESVTANLALTMRHFDSLPFPTRGWAWGVELGAGTTLGSDPVPYSRVLARWQSILPLGLGPDTAKPTDLRAGRLALRAQAGAVLARDGVSLPTTQLFLAGGDSSVRGYALHDIGVRLPDGRISAGRYLTVGGLEWQRPITVDGRLTDWEGTLFIDAGAVADAPADLRAKVGTGVGARWKTPVGPLQIDLAYGIDARRFRLHLNMGFVF